MDDAGPDREKFKCVPDKWSPTGWKYKFGDPSNNVFSKGSGNINAFAITGS